jgi:hypothetical protein
LQYQLDIGFMMRMSHGRLEMAFANEGADILVVGVVVGEFGATMRFVRSWNVSCA